MYCFHLFAALMTANFAEDAIATAYNAGLKYQN
jgi:hypothetical protein